jgi:hypothetical protein
MRVTKDAPVRREQVHPGSVMLKGNARLPQPEPVSAQRPYGLKFSPFSSRRKIPSEAINTKLGKSKNENTLRYIL